MANHIGSGGGLSLGELLRCVVDPRLPIEMPVGGPGMAVIAAACLVCSLFAP